MSLEFLPNTENYEFWDEMVKPTVSDSSIFKSPKILEILNNPNDLLSIEWEPGMSLSQIATDYLANSFAWEAIADINGINPFDSINVGKILKVPTTEQITKGLKRFLLNSSVTKEIQGSIKGSILDLTGLSNPTSKVGQNLKECIDKIIDFNYVGNDNK